MSLCWKRFETVPIQTLEQTGWIILFLCRNSHLHMFSMFAIWHCCVATIQQYKMYPMGKKTSKGFWIRWHKLQGICFPHFLSFKQCLHITSQQTSQTFEPGVSSSKHFPLLPNWKENNLSSNDTIKKHFSSSDWTLTDSQTPALSTKHYIIKYPTQDFCPKCLSPTVSVHRFTAMTSKYELNCVVIESKVLVPLNLTEVLKRKDH